MSKGRLFTIFGAAFGVVGVALLIVCVALGASTARFLASAERTDGTVVGLTEHMTMRESDGRHYRSTVWRPTIEFTVDGQEYVFESSVGSAPAAYARGDTVPVAYDPDDPSDARIASFGSAFLAPLIVGGIGLIFTPIGTVFLVKGRRHAKLRSWLYEHGREIWADEVRVGIDTKTRINGRHPYVVHATWQDRTTGRSHTATSDFVRVDPGPSLQRHTYVRVLYDPDDPERNLVDLESVHLPEPGERRGGGSN